MKRKETDGLGILRCGIVVSSGTYSSAVMERGGRITRIMNKGTMKKGKRILFTDEDVCPRVIETVLHPSFAHSCIAAAALFIAVLSPVINYNLIPSAVISLDVNPGIEMFISSSMVVRKAQIVHDPEKLDFTAEQLQGKSLERVLYMVKTNMEQHGLVETETPVLAGYAPVRTRFVIGARKLSESSRKTVRGVFAHQNIVYIDEDIEGYRQSRKDGTDIGRFAAEEMIKQQQMPASPDCRTETVPAIIQQLQGKKVSAVAVPHAEVLPAVRDTETVHTPEPVHKPESVQEQPSVSHEPAVQKQAVIQPPKPAADTVPLFDETVYEGKTDDAGGRFFLFDKDNGKFIYESGESSEPPERFYNSEFFEAGDDDTSVTHEKSDSSSGSDDDSDSDDDSSDSDDSDSGSSDDSGGDSDSDGDD